MMIVLVIAGIGAILAGVVAILYGVALELSLGNSLIVAGTVGASSGLLLLALAMVLRELRVIARRLTMAAAGEGQVRSQARSGAEEEDFGFDQPLPAGRNRSESAPAPSSWPEETGSRGRPDELPEPGPAAKPRRNLLFASASRKERERAQARSTESMPADPLGPPLAADPGEAPPANLDDTWLKIDRGRPGAPPPLRRGGRAPPAPAEANAEAAARGAPRAEPPGVTVLKSGVVDGMAYSLYSDGSIEAQMPEGMMRFASLDELTAHIERRA